MDDAIRSLVRSRANGRCEYCLLHENEDGFVFHVEHIIPKKHRGDSELENLTFACNQCNRQAYCLLPFLVLILGQRRGGILKALVFLAFYFLSVLWSSQLRGIPGHASATKC